jgi:hypothetical protein
MLKQCRVAGLESLYRESLCFCSQEKRMIDFVFFDGQLWTYDEWAKIAPLTLLCPEIEPSPNARLWDEGYSNE